jgi:predicted nucleic acid-binding protein
VRTALDTNVLPAVWLREARAEELAERIWQAKAEGTIVVSGIVYSELLANPRTTEDFVNGFLEDAGVMVDSHLPHAGWVEAGRRFGQYGRRRKASGGGEPKRMLADFIVGAHALLQADRLMTLDAERYRVDFPELKIL